MENSPFRVGFCVSGQGRLFRAAVQYQQLLGIEPALVVMESKAAQELDAFCEKHHVPIVRLEKMERSLFDKAVTQTCVDANLDLLSLTFDKLVPQELVSHYRRRIINVHPGLLPAFKGFHAMEQAINAGARYAGATIHEVDEEMDHGAIISQCVVGIHKNETASALGARIYNHLKLMYLQVLAWYGAGRVEWDSLGRIWIQGATYGETPISPTIELSFPD